MREYSDGSADDLAHRVVIAQCHQSADPLSPLLDVRKRITSGPLPGQWAVDKRGSRVGGVVPQEYFVADIHDACRLLRRLIQHKDSAYYAIVAGALTPDRRAEASTPPHTPIPRLSVAQNGVYGSFIDQPRHLHFLDFDDIPLPAHLTALSALDSIAHWLRSVLPSEFDDRTVLVQLTSSHGLNPNTARARLLFWSSAAVTGAHIKRYVVERLNPHVSDAIQTAKNVLDSQLYSAAHLIYAANPDAPADFPIQHRLTLIEGASDEVRLVPLADRPVVPRDSGNAPKPPTASIESLVAALGTDAMTQTIKLKATYALAAKTPQRQLPGAIETLAEQMRQRIVETTPDPQKQAERLQDVKLSEIARLTYGARQRYIERWHVSDPLEGVYSPTLEDARHTLTHEMERIVETSLQHNTRATATLIRITPGAGKTEALYRALTPTRLRDHRIIKLDPDLTLGSQSIDRLLKTQPELGAGLARLHKGRNQEGMCLNTKYGKFARLFESVGLSPYEPVCTRCPQHSICPWVFQRADVGKGFVCTSHAALVSTMASVKDGDADKAADLYAIDESASRALLPDAKSLPMRLLQPRAPWDDIREKRRPWEATGRELGLLGLEFVHHREDLVRMGTQHWGTIPLSAVRLDKLGRAIEAEEAAQRYMRTELNTLATEGGELGRLDGKSRNRWRWYARGLYRAHAVSGRVLQLYRALLASASVPGRTHVFGVRIAYTSKAERAFVVQLRAKLPGVLAHRDSVWLDATGNSETWSRLLGPIAEKITTRTVDVRVTPEHYHLTQYPDRIYGKRFWQLDRDDTDRQHAKHAQSRIVRLQRFVWLQACKYSTVLLICQAEVEEALKTLGLPRNVSTLHFGRLRGQDEHKRVACTIVVGRAAPRDEALELAAEALVHDDVRVATIVASTGAMLRNRRQLPLRHPTGERASVTIDVESHADGVVRAIRDDLVDAEVIQAVMRCRPLDRTADNPAVIHVFGQCDTGLEINALGAWVDATTDLDEIALARGIIGSTIPLNRMLYPGVWFARNRGDASCMEDVIAQFKQRSCTQLMVSSAGVRSSCVYVLRERHSDPAATVCDLLPGSIVRAVNG